MVSWAELRPELQSSRQLVGSDMHTAQNGLSRRPLSPPTSQIFPGEMLGSGRSSLRGVTGWSMHHFADLFGLVFGAMGWDSAVLVGMCSVL